MGLTVISKIFLTFSLNGGIFHIILSVPQKTIMDLNDVLNLTLHLLILIFQTLWKMCAKNAPIAGTYTTAKWRAETEKVFEQCKSAGCVRLCRHTDVLGCTLLYPSLYLPSHCLWSRNPEENTESSWIPP